MFEPRRCLGCHLRGFFCFSLPNNGSTIFIDFIVTWQFGRYSTKGNAEHIVKQKLKENEDYILLTNIRKQNDGKTAFDRRGGHNAKNYILSGNGFIKFLKISDAVKQCQCNKIILHVQIFIISLKYLKNSQKWGM